MKVLIAVSGTGGHIYPGIAVAEELRSRHPDLSILFAAARGKPGADWIRAAGFEVRDVPLRGIARRPSLSWLAFPFWLVAGCAAVVSLLAAEAPALVVGTGGYVSGPFVAFASLLRIPTMVLEQNSIPGVATRLGSLVATQTHLAFPESRAALLRKGRAVVSGNPVRRSVAAGDGAAFRRAHGIDASRPLVLVLGGSQGARAVTGMAIDAAKLLGENAAIAMFVQTGSRGFEEARARAAGAPRWLALAPFVEEMGGAYAAAALVVGRSGATTLAELAEAGLPSILVPYPFAAKDHQTTNARRLEAAGAAVVVAEGELTAAGLAARITALVEDAALRESMAAAVRRAGSSGARERVALACEKLLGLG